MCGINLSKKKEIFKKMASEGRLRFHLKIFRFLAARVFFCCFFFQLFRS